MKTTIIPCDHHDAISIAKTILDEGKIIAFPTDTLYGIAAFAFNAPGIQRLYEVKQRDLSKAIAVLVANMEQASSIAREITVVAQGLAERFWPGAITLVVPKQPGLPDNLSPLQTIGIRMPNHPFTLSLLAQTGPLATTSANISGGTNPLTAEDVYAQLNGSIDLILDGGKTPGTTGSTVVDCTSHPLKILRQGSISAKDIFDTIDIESE